MLLFVVRCSLFIVVCWLLVCCSLFIVSCLLVFGVRCPLLVVGCWLLGACCLFLLFDDWRLVLVIVCCFRLLLNVVCWLLFVIV